MKKIVLFVLLMLPVAVMGQKNSVDYGCLDHEVNTFGDKICFENYDKATITYTTTRGVELGEEEVYKKLEEIQEIEYKNFFALNKQFNVSFDIITKDIFIYKPIYGAEFGEDEVQKMISETQNKDNEYYNASMRQFDYCNSHFYIDSSDGHFKFLKNLLKLYISHLESETPYDKKAAKLHRKKIKSLSCLLNASHISNNNYKEALEWYKTILNQTKNQTKKLYTNLQDSLQERIVITKKNKFYRGRNYIDHRILNSLENSLPAKGWEWLNTNNYIQKEVRYPEQLNYIVFNNVPQYKVFVSWSDRVDNKINHKNAVVYNNKGTLVYVPNIWRDDIEFKNIEEDIKKIIYLKDYKHNKYNIKQKSGETQAEIIANLSRKNESKYKNIVFPKNSYVNNYSSDYLSTIALVGISIAAQNLKNDIVFKDYWNYKKQLEIDHSAEFGYVYIIERISGVSFRLVYIHKETLKPTYCALVTYKETGDKSYTCDYSIKLIDIPKQIPTPIHIPRGFVISECDVKLIDPECKY